MSEKQLQAYAEAMLSQMGDIASIEEEQYSVKVVGVPFKKNQASIEGGDFDYFLFECLNRLSFHNLNHFELYFQKISLMQWVCLSTLQL